MKLLWKITRAGTLAVLLIGLQLVQAADTGAPVTEPIADNVNKRLDKIERLLQSQGLLDMLQLIEQLQTEVNKMRGELEVQTHALEQLKKRQRDIYGDIDTRLQRLESGNNQTGSTTNAPPLETLAATTAPTTEETSTTEPVIQVEMISNKIDQGKTETKPVDNTVAAETPPNTNKAAVATEVNPAKIQADYQRAFKLLREAQYTQAVEAFNAFLDRYPDSQYSDNAQYWLGEAYYVMQDYQKAISEYEKLLSTYPDSQKVAHAQLKIGYSYHELGNLKDAQAKLRELIQKYPGTTAARLAEDRLRQIQTTTE